MTRLPLKRCESPVSAEAIAASGYTPPAPKPTMKREAASTMNTSGGQ
eukprot:CAMPEP_0202112806 /NCGR_PEP_ID=MMETSP0965-20130614/32462_1 /ASSEMBLY_ACC=CAM_ASM_000507 /TAXON_ID=4773 /ORGANISM="Schizochytrium aggregatum, Strain ATCC28209" /LENGTH=46 /DNA_ID= /DNA_START= /DNA_END= /DNA_ORIENTATION=